MPKLSNFDLKNLNKNIVFVRIRPTNQGFHFGNALDKNYQAFVDKKNEKVRVCLEIQKANFTKMEMHDYQ